MTARLPLQIVPNALHNLPIVAPEVHEATPGDRHDWDDYVAARPDGSAFHWFGWREALGSALGYETRYLVARRAGAVVGVLPLAVVRSRLWGRSVCSQPFCSYGGPLVDDAGTLQALEAAARSIAIAVGAPHVEFRRVAPCRADWPRQSLYVTFRGGLPSRWDEGDLRPIPSKRRNMVRRAIANGLTADVGRDVGEFFELYAENARAHGTPALPRRFFERLLPALGDRCDILFVRDRDGRAVSAILNLYHGADLHAGFAGELPAARSLAANDFKYYALMRHAVTRGCRSFDFGRSKVGTGSYEFKRLWGFEPTPLNYEFMMIEGGDIPQNNPTNPKFQLAMRVWTRLPRFVVDRLGPLVIHGLG